MSIEAEVSALTTATADLVGATNAGVAALNASLLIATTAAATATAQAGIATTSATAALNAAAYELLTWAYAQNFRLVSATRNSDGAVTSANITWPDGVAGVYTATAISTEFPGATDAWSATYASVPPKTITQPAVSRNSDGAVTAQPAITIV